MKAERERLEKKIKDRRAKRKLHLKRKDEMRSLSLR